MLPLDPSLQQVYKNNTIENNLQVGLSNPASISARMSIENARTRKSSELQMKMMSGRNSMLATDKELAERGPASIETIMKRNNSITVVKKHAVPFSSLHKKTYFNALEKILISPKGLRNMDKPVDDDIANVTGPFETVFRKPPSRMDDSSARKAKGKSGKKSTIKVKEKAISGAQSDSDDES